MDRSVFCVFVLSLWMLLFLFCNDVLFARESPPEDRLDKEFLINFRDDFIGVITSPKDWDHEDIITLSAVFGGGILLYTVDKDIQGWFQEHRTSSSNNFVKIIRPFGNGGLMAGLISTLYASGELTHNKSLRKTALLSLESWLTSGVIVLGLKCVTGRARPKTDESSHGFHPFSTRSSFTSFPSGDATSAFAVATTIADQSDKTYIDALAFSLATLVALGRIHDNKHWASDVFIGSALGYVVSKKVSFFNRNRELHKLGIGLRFSREKRAFVLTFSF